MIYVHRSSRIISTVQFPTLGRCKHDTLQMWTSLETEVNKRGVCVSSAITRVRVKITARRTPTTLPLLPLTRCSTAAYKNLNCISTDGQDMFFFCGQLNPFDIYHPIFSVKDAFMCYPPMFAYVPAVSCNKVLRPTYCIYYIHRLVYATLPHHRLLLLIMQCAIITFYKCAIFAIIPRFNQLIYQKILIVKSDTSVSRYRQQKFHLCCLYQISLVCSQ